MRMITCFAASAALAIAASPLPVSAQQCTPGGWCVRYGDDNGRMMYRYVDRTGDYLRVAQAVPSPRMILFMHTYDCRRWLVSIENEPFEVIVPGSINDGIARQLC